MLSKNFKLRNKLLIGFAIPVVAIVAMATIVYGSVNSLLKANHWVDHTHKVIAEGKSILSSMVDMETGMRGYLLAGKDEFLNPYINGGNRFEALLKELQKTVNDNPAQVKLLDETKETARRKKS